jgi:hypothetical protein
MSGTVEVFRTRYDAFADVPGVEDSEPTEDERFALYELRPCRECGGSGSVVVPSPTEVIGEGVSGQGVVSRRCPYCQRGKQLTRLATTTKEGIGTALVALAEDAREAGDGPLGPIGCLDRVERRWVCIPWARGL